jgi:hypothetical protein
MRIILMCLLINVFLSCNFSSDKKDMKTADKMSRESYSEGVFEIWENSINELNEIIGQKPALTTELKKQVAELKEKTIQNLLPFGREHEKQPEAEKKNWSKKFIEKMGLLSVNKAWENTMNACYRHYVSLDYQFASEIASFNTITQYADFGLLKLQNPAEAKRLGIE